MTFLKTISIDVKPNRLYSLTARWSLKLAIPTSTSSSSKALFLELLDWGNMLFSTGCDIFRDEDKDHVSSWSEVGLEVRDKAGDLPEKSSVKDI